MANYKKYIGNTPYQGVGSNGLVSFPNGTNWSLEDARLVNNTMLGDIDISSNNILSVDKLLGQNNNNQRIHFPTTGNVKLAVDDGAGGLVEGLEIENTTGNVILNIGSSTGGNIKNIRTLEGRNIANQVIVYEENNSEINFRN